ncbi:MAG: hypothetical protein Kow00108_15750 [Calditrichia bacterium]
MNSIKFCFFGYVILFTLSFCLNGLSQRITWISVPEVGGSISVHDITPDGQFLVGEFEHPNGDISAFKWSQATGFILLPRFGGNEAKAFGISDDGSIVVGWSNDEEYNEIACRWLADTIFALGTLGGDNSAATDISGDGTIIVGEASVFMGTSSFAFYWTESGGMQRLDFGALDGSKANAISDDWTRIVGYFTPVNEWAHACIWDDGIRDSLGTLGGIFSFAFDISSNGQFVVGVSADSNNYSQAFIWDDNQGFTPLGFIDVNNQYSEALGVDNSGKKVVGTASIGFSNNHAFLWTPDSGMEDLNVKFEALIPTDMYLRSAKAITPDGRYITGEAIQMPGYIYYLYILDTENPIQITEHDPQLTESMVLEQNYPNPFNPTTTIRFGLHEPSTISLDIFSITGQHVKNLVRDTYPEGIHEVMWDGTDSQNQPVASGVYIYKLTAPKQTLSGKMVLMK